MTSRPRRASLAVIAAAVLGVTACTGADRGSGTARFNDAARSVVNPSDHRGGILRYALPGEPDSFDPGNTYFFNSTRLWARSLTTYRPRPGKAGLKLVPDLATSLGKVSDGGRTWTYTIRSGLRYSDGSAIHAADVKYAVERSSFAPSVLSNGPAYLRNLLRDNTPPYRGPYADKSGGLDSIETPNDTTIVFRLNQPFADFDYVASFPQTAPVPRAKDDGADYVKHVVSSGSYVLTSYDQNLGAVLVRNHHWDAATDPIRKQYADEIHIAFNRDQHDIDDDLIAGNLDLDFGGNGMAASSQAAIESDPGKKANTDSNVLGATDMLQMSRNVKPFDDINCRRAVQYGVDKLSVQTSIGGPLRGRISSTVLPPTIPGQVDFNLYPSKNDAGDLAKAKDALTRCGHPDGFDTTLATIREQPALVSAATSIQASLRRIGIRVRVAVYSFKTGSAGYLGAPAYVHTHDIGLFVTTWAADWPDGYGFMYPLIDGAAILPTGNSNLAELNDPSINALLRAAVGNGDVEQRTGAWSRIDRAVMADASIVPLVYRKELTYRPPTTTNVTVSLAYAGYDLLNIGRK